MRIVVRLVLVLVLLVVVASVSVNVLAVPREEIAPPDPGTPITLPDGTIAPLSDVVARLEARRLARASEPETSGGEAPGERDGAPAPDDADDLLVPGTVIDGGDGMRLVYGTDRVLQVEWDTDDVFGLAESKFNDWRAGGGDGDPQELLALYRSVPRDHPSYARACRRIGWHLYGDELEEPERGVAYLNEALLRDPLDGNSWQDLCRGYLGTLGLPMD